MEILGVGFSSPSGKYLKIWPRRVQKDTGSEKRKQLVSFPAHSGIYTPLRVALFGFFKRPEVLERNL